MEICNVSGAIRGNWIPAIRVSRGPFFHGRAWKPLLMLCAGDSLRDSDSGNRMFILGMGYVGRFFAEQLKSQGWIVSGTCRSAWKMKELKERGFSVYPFDANEPPDLEILENMRSHTHLLVSIPPVADVGDPMLKHEGFVRNSLINGNLEWLSYLSSTSVYGSSGGAWVDEDYPVSPTSMSATLRVAAEEKWLTLGNELGISTQIFRLGGIYGPGRSALDTIMKQIPFSVSQKRRASKHYTARIHVADICQALKAAISLPKHRRIFNIVDDDPASRAEVFAFAQHLIQEKWPNQAKQFRGTESSSLSFQEKDSILEKPEQRSSMEEKYERDEKRVSNGRMKKELQLKLIYPSYRLGLQSIINHIQNPS